MSNAKKRLPFRPIERHLRATRMLGYALTMRDWAGLMVVFAARLDPQELAGVAVAAIEALPDDCRRSLVEFLADHVLGERNPPSRNVMEEAQLRAEFSSRDECKAGAWAFFHALSPTDQAAFLHQITKQEAAA